MAAKEAPQKKTPMSKGQAQKVAAFLKKGGNGGPKPPTPATNPVTTADDDNDED